MIVFLHGLKRVIENFQPSPRWQTEILSFTATAVVGKKKREITLHTYAFSTMQKITTELKKILWLEWANTVNMIVIHRMTHYIVPLPEGRAIWNRISLWMVLSPGYRPKEHLVKDQ